MNLVINTIERHDELQKERRTKLCEWNSKKDNEYRNYELKIADAIIQEFGDDFAHKLGGILLAATEK